MSGLLHHMCELMGQETPARIIRGIVLSGAEHDVPTGRVRQGVDGACRLFGVSFGMHSDLAEIMAETRLEKLSSFDIQRPAGRAEFPVHRLGDGRGVCAAVGPPLNIRLFLSAFLAVLAAGGTGTWRGNGIAGVQPHDMVRNLVGLALLGIICLADRQLCLDQAAAQKLLHGEISGVLLHRQEGMHRRGGGRGAPRQTQARARALALMTNHRLEFAG